MCDTLSENIENYFTELYTVILLGYLAASYQLLLDSVKWVSYYDVTRIQGVDTGDDFEI